MRCATRGRLVDSGSGFDAPALLPGHGPATRRPLPSPGCSRHEFPGFSGTMERSDSRPSVPAHFVAFARRLPPRAPVFVAPHKPGAGLGPGVFGSGHPQSLSLSRRRRSGVPSSWGTPIPVCPVHSTPAGLRAPDRCSAATWPLVCEKQRLPRKVFRRSIAGLPGSLSTLRRVGYPAATQDSLPAVGQTLLDGLLPAGFHRKVSECFVTSHPPSPGFAWRNHIDRSGWEAHSPPGHALSLWHLDP